MTLEEDDTVNEVSDAPVDVAEDLPIEQESIKEAASRVDDAEEAVVSSPLPAPAYRDDDVEDAEEATEEEETMTPAEDKEAISETADVPPLYQSSDTVQSPDKNAIGDDSKLSADEESVPVPSALAPTPSMTPITIKAPPTPQAMASPASGNTQLDLIRDQLLALSQSNKLDKMDAKRLSLLIKDYDGLKDKVGKIKSLLGRSAKAQREAKVELDVTQKRLDHALREVQRLQTKIDKLANRPTHMELLADFETNFDRALLSVNQSNVSSTHQSGGQDTAPPQYADSSKDANHNFMDALLMQEVQDAKARIDKLESLNSNLVQRSNALEQAGQQFQREREELQRQVQHLQLEKRMAVMEAEQAMRALHDKTASLEEMQLELDLVTKASRSAKARAEHEQERIQHAKSDRQHVMELEAQVAALNEWALAANEAKSLAQERVRLLETQLRTLQSSSNQPKSTALENSVERILFSKPGSLVVGAGDSTCTVVELSAEDVKSVKLSERVILRWRFDLVQDDVQIDFSILKSKCETKQKQKNADYLVKDRLVIGGAAGETENAFAIQRSCTLLWSNSKAWIRPKTVRFNVEAVAVED
ncbi:hypothetical protein MPSEU_000248400 [Mayamaea pseudoterrestris]|nr:hypothetical protein MPSEU_000248400 [Mayamaea pseudoterrestris]